MRRLVLGLTLVMGACRGATLGALPTENQEEPASSSADGGASQPARDAEPDSVDAAASAGESTRGPSVAAGEGGNASALAGCGAEPVTLDEIHSGRVRDTLPVSVEALVASSQKFLLSEAKSGSCLWGAFAAAAGRTGAGSGLFLVSYGAKHAEGEACAPGSDGLPDDLVPGDSLEVEGRLDEYVPSTCAGTVPAQQLRIDAACPARRGAPVEPPEPALLEPALADRLAAGKDVQLLRDWGGALVRLENASALQDSDDGDAVYPFGVIRLQPTALEVHSRLYYFDLSEGGPRASDKAPHFRFPSVFQSLSGVVFLDYCAWVLAPRNRCTDLSPPSEGCAGQVARP